MKQKRRNKHSNCRSFFISILLLLFLFSPVTAFAQEKVLVPCGELFGVELSLKGVLVTRYAPFVAVGETGETSPAKDAGVLEGDLIFRVDEVNVLTASDLSKAVASSNGCEMSVHLLRAGREEQLSLRAKKSAEDDRYHAGIWVREDLVGVGTLTYYDPQSKTFGGLGHGICADNTEVVLPIESGRVCKAHLEGVVKGVVGEPGQLKATFEKPFIGTVNQNTQQGVFGNWDKSTDASKALRVAPRTEVVTGKAQLVSTVEGDKPALYDIEIVRITDAEAKTKNFLIRVTDDALLEKTGGIVQGMSGSPILQNGKFVGALTHVLVSHPDMGYGIYLENMLETAG